MSLFGKAVAHASHQMMHGNKKKKNGKKSKSSRWGKGQKRGIRFV